MHTFHIIPKLLILNNTVPLLQVTVKMYLSNTSICVTIETSQEESEDIDSLVTYSLLLIRMMII